MKKCFSAAIVAVLLLGLTAFAGAVDTKAPANAAPATKTLDNLQAAYNNQSNAHIRYLTFAEKASEEGYDVAASLFKALAFAEKVRYQRSAAIIKSFGAEPKSEIETPAVNSTKENLELALKTEEGEAETMYPELLAQAKKDNVPDAVTAFEQAQKAESVYRQLFTQMLANLNLSQGLVKNFYVCPGCGNVVDAITQSRCPICGTDTRKFRMIK